MIRYPPNLSVLVQRELDKCLTLLSNNRRPYVDGFGLWLRHRPCEFFRYEGGSEYLFNAH